jgi:hypothetical protein
LAVLPAIECEGCHRHRSVHLPREMTAPDEPAREKTSEDKQIEIERADARNLGYGFADGREDIVLRCRITRHPDPVDTQVATEPQSVPDALRGLFLIGASIVATKFKAHLNKGDGLCYVGDRAGCVPGI